MATLRLLGVGWWMQMKMLMRSSFNSVLAILYPLFFATVAFFMFRAGSPDALLYASLGASVMGVWGAVSTSAGSAMQRERWEGTLELLVTAPARFPLVMLPTTIAMSTPRPVLDGGDPAVGQIASSGSACTSSTRSSSAPRSSSPCSRSASPAS